MSVLVRGIVSLIAVLAWGWICFFYNTLAPLVSGPLAGKQLENTDTGYVAAQYGMRLFSWLGLMSTLALLAILAVIWWSVIRQRLDRDTVKRLTFGMLPALALLVVG